VCACSSPSEVSRAAPESARVRRAWVKPEAHGYINVKAYKYGTLQPVGLPISHDVAHYVHRYVQYDRLKRVKKEWKGFVEYPTQNHHEWDHEERCLYRRTHGNTDAERQVIPSRDVDRSYAFCNATHHRKQNERNPFLANGPGQLIHGFDEPFRSYGNQDCDNDEKRECQRPAQLGFLLARCF